jgi:pyruvate/2-oxoglutarate/acetoin dehydrogenase E1 component
MPSTASDAYWMMREAIALDDPVIFLENKHLYFRNVEDVDEAEGPRGFGARIARGGTDLTVVTSGRMTHRCIEAAEAMAADGIEAEVVDMRYIWPLDTGTVGRSLEKTSRLAVVYEAVEFSGWGAEVAAWAAEHRFDDLDAPIVRIGSVRSPIPFQSRLEDEVVPTTERIEAALREMAGY